MQKRILTFHVPHRAEDTRTHHIYVYSYNIGRQRRTHSYLSAQNMYEENGKCEKKTQLITRQKIVEIE